MVQSFIAHMPLLHTHTCLTALCPGLPWWAGTRKVKPIWILLKQETGSGNGISWAICQSAPRSRQITTPAPHHSVFYRPDAFPAAQPTASKHWRHWTQNQSKQNFSWVIMSVISPHTPKFKMIAPLRESEYGWNISRVAWFSFFVPQILRMPRAQTTQPLFMPFDS